MLLIGFANKGAFIYLNKGPFIDIHDSKPISDISRGLELWDARRASCGLCYSYFDPINLTMDLGNDC